MVVVVVIVVVVVVSHFDWFLSLHVDVRDVLGVLLTLAGVHQTKLEVFDKFCGQFSPGLTGGPGARPLTSLVPPERVDQLGLSLSPGVDIARLPHCGLTDSPGTPALPALYVSPLLVRLHQFVAPGPLPPPVVFPGSGAPTL